jgi:hypothetical protein
MERIAGVRLFAGFALLTLAGCVTAPAPPASPAPPPPSVIPPPQVMVILNEQSADGQAGVMSEALAVPLLLARHVTVVDPSTVQANRDRMRTLLTQNGDEQGALMVGLQLGADVVISGTVETKRLAAQLAGSNLKSYMATVTLRGGVDGDCAGGRNRHGQDAASGAERHARQAGAGDAAILGGAAGNRAVEASRRLGRDDRLCPDLPG